MAGGVVLTPTRRYLRGFWVYWALLIISVYQYIQVSFQVIFKKPLSSLYNLLDSDGATVGKLFNLTSISVVDGPVEPI